MKKLLIIILIFILNFNCSYAVEEIKLETEKNTFDYLSDVYYGKVEDANPVLKLFSQDGLKFKDSFVNSVKFTLLYSSEFSFIDKERNSSSFIHDFSVFEPMVTAKFNDNKTTAMFDINLLRNFEGYSNDFTHKISRLYIAHDITENQRISFGQENRVPSTYNGSRGTFAQDFVIRSQLGRTYGNASSVGIRNTGKYKYFDYDIGLYDSTRFMKDFGQGLDFTGYLMFKPLADFKDKVGDLRIGTGYGVGEYYNSYSLYSFFIGYDKNKFHLKTEFADANGYNGISCSRDESNGFYTMLGYDLTPKITLVGRYDYLNPNKDIYHDTSQEFAAGVTYKIFKNMKFMINYVHRDFANKSDSNMFLFATRFIL